MDSKQTQNIAVVAAKEDQQMIADLLSDTSYHLSLYPNDAIFNAGNQQYHAVVIFHRRTVPTPQPSIPVRRGSSRIIVCSDCKQEHTIVKALEAGAHYFFYNGEPLRIIKERLLAALRIHSQSIRRLLDVPPFRFNLERRHVYMNGKPINLSPKEYEFAYYLFANRDRVVVNSELMTSVWSLPSKMDARRIDTAACRVRKKMQLNSHSHGWNLRRLRCVGYELQWKGAAPAPASEESPKPAEASTSADENTFPQDQRKIEMA